MTCELFDCHHPVLFWFLVGNFVACSTIGFAYWVITDNRKLARQMKDIDDTIDRISTHLHKPRPEWGGQSIAQKLK